MKNLKHIKLSAKKVLSAVNTKETDSEILRVLDSISFQGDCKSGLEARLDYLIKLDKVDSDYHFIRYLAKNSSELILDTNDFKGVIELEKYLRQKYCKNGIEYLSITIWPLTTKTIQIEISMSAG